MGKVVGKEIWLGYLCNCGQNGMNSEERLGTRGSATNFLQSIFFTFLFVSGDGCFYVHIHILF